MKNVKQKEVTVVREKVEVNDITDFENVVTVINEKLITVTEVKDIGGILISDIRTLKRDRTEDFFIVSQNEGEDGL